ncbi:MAG: glycosyltransferase family 4 protein [Anaerolineae bacterium]
MLNNEFPPLGGGTGTVNRVLLQHFASVQGLEIDLITSALGQQDEFEQFAEHIRIFKAPVNNRNLHHSSNRELLTFGARAWPLALKLHRTTRYDFCFAWSAVPAGGVALALHWQAGLRYIVRVCGPDIPGFERRYGWMYPFLTPAIRATWRGAEWVIAKCEHEAEMIRRVDSSARITLIPNGVDLDAFQPGAPIPDAGALKVICVGRLIERKGQQHLIRATRRLVDQGLDISVELVGTGDAQSADAELARELGIADQIRFSGYVPREEIAKHYAAAHVFVLPSYNEGMSVATLEAMASGLPIIITRNGATGLVQAEINGLIFDWANVDALTAHLKRLAMDRALARRMGAASRDRATSLSWDLVSDDYLKMFEQMVPRAPVYQTGQKLAI